MIPSRKRLFLFILALSFFTVKGQNYDETKVPVYLLPDVLKLSDGRTVETKKVWEQKRRQEVLNLFEEHVYGQFPKDFDSIRFTIVREERNAMDGKATLKEVAIITFRNQQKATIDLTVFIPNNIKKPVPAFLLINNREKFNTDPTRNIKKEFWPAEEIIVGGYAIAAFQVSDAAPDHKDSFQNGILKLYPEQLNTANGMRAIGAWAWAASRVMDYFEREKDIDKRRVALVGHSRGGKAALWAGAQDQRFALIFSNNSGNTGAALSRRRFGETIKVINEAFPHWFTDNYKMYNDNENKLPVDQHMLLALIAPRPLYVTSASNDLWADPTGSYLSLLHSQPVYNLYKKRSALPPVPPPIDSHIIHSHAGYHNRKGDHDLTLYDWKNFMLFANYHYKKKKRLK